METLETAWEAAQELAALDEDGQLMAVRSAIADDFRAVRNDLREFAGRSGLLFDSRLE
jgi:hypothetical protein